MIMTAMTRLARYNATAEELSDGADKVACFEGAPIPSSAVLTGVLAFAAWCHRLSEDLRWGVWCFGWGDLQPLALLFSLSAMLMISKTLRIPKL
jgi:CDP-diacylglycerol--serine O-phosphatidyltransferase